MIRLPRGPAVPFAATFLTLTAACDLRFTDPPEEASSRLSVTVVFYQGPGDRLVVEGSFFPGRDEGGRPRPVLAEAIWVGGDPVNPADTSEDGVRVYSGEVGVAPGEGPLAWELRGPQVGGVEVPEPLLTFGMCHRTGGEEVAVGEDEVVRLEGACPTALVARGAEWANWSLVVGSGPQEGILRLQGPGDPPLPLEIPVAWLPTDEASELTAELQAHRVLDVALAPDRYHVQLLLVAQITWTVLLSPDSGG